MTPEPVHPAQIQSLWLFTIIFAPITTGIIVTLFGIWANNKARNFYKGWEEYNKLRDETDKAFKSRIEASYTCLRTSIQTLKDSKADKNMLDKEAKELRESLSKEAEEIRSRLEKRAENIWLRLNHHEHAIDCDGADCTAKRTSGVIPTE